MGFWLSPDLSARDSNIGPRALTEGLTEVRYWSRDDRSGDDEKPMS